MQYCEQLKMDAGQSPPKSTPWRVPRVRLRFRVVGKSARSVETSFSSTDALALRRIVSWSPADERGSDKDIVDAKNGMTQPWSVAIE